MKSSIIFSIMQTESFIKFCMVRSHWNANYLIKYLSENCDVTIFHNDPTFYCFSFNQNRLNK